MNLTWQTTGQALVPPSRPVPQASVRRKHSMCKHRHLCCSSKLTSSLPSFRPAAKRTAALVSLSSLRVSVACLSGAALQQCCRLQHLRCLLQHLCCPCVRVSGGEVWDLTSINSTDAVPHRQADSADQGQAFASCKFIRQLAVKPHRAGEAECTCCCDRLLARELPQEASACRLSRGAEVSAAV